MPDTTPEVFYDGTLPEAHNNEKPIEDCLDVTRTARKWPWIIIALVLAAAIAVGVSVGIWHHRERSLQMPSRFSRYGNCLARISSRLTFLAHRRRTSHNLLRLFLKVHLWQLYYSPMGIDNYSSRITLVSSNVRLAFNLTANGPRATISMAVRILFPNPAPTPRDIRHWQQPALHGMQMYKAKSQNISPFAYTLI